jgi:hypothetical protein
MCERIVSIRVSPPVKPAPVYEAATIFAATGIPSVLPSNGLGHDSHDADMLCSGVCSSISKKYLAWRGSPFCLLTADS